MPPRALWKGSISFGLVSVPINLVSATEPREALAFNLLHRKDRSRIVEKRFCAKENVEVSWKDIVKGYQFAKDQYVVVTDEDFAKVRVPATQTFDIRRFVPAADVEDLYFNYPYYVTPQGKSAVKAYALLRDALRATGKLAIGTIVLRQREHLAALEPVGAALVLTTMRYAHEIRRQKDLELPPSGQGWTDSEMKLARQLIETLAGEWNPDEYRDTYSEALRRVIEAKVEGKETAAPERPAPARVTASWRLSSGASKMGRGSPPERPVPAGADEGKRPPSRFAPRERRRADDRSAAPRVPRSGLYGAGRRDSRMLLRPSSASGRRTAEGHGWIETRECSSSPAPRATARPRRAVLGRQRPRDRGAREIARR